MFQHSLFRDFFINMIEACGGGRHCIKFGHLVVYVHLNRTIQVFVQTLPPSISNAAVVALHQTHILELICSTP